MNRRPIITLKKKPPVEPVAQSTEAPITPASVPEAKPVAQSGMRRPAHPVKPVKANKPAKPVKPVKVPMAPAYKVPDPSNIGRKSAYVLNYFKHHANQEQQVQVSVRVLTQTMIRLRLFKKVSAPWMKYIMHVDAILAKLMRLELIQKIAEPQRLPTGYQIPTTYLLLAKAQEIPLFPLVTHLPSTEIKATV